MAHKPKYDYFKAFEKQIGIAMQAVDLLIEAIDYFTTVEDLHEVMTRAHELEHEGDQITHETFTAIAVDFITPIDRDDIIELSQALDDVTDDIEDVIQLFYTMDVQGMHKDTSQMATLIKENCEALMQVTVEFPDFKKSAASRQAIVDVNTYEEEADVLFANLMRDLHVNHKDDPMYVLVWSRIFSKMEACDDACEHVADLIGGVMLKNS